MLQFCLHKYYERIRLYSGEYIIPQPSPQSRHDNIDIDGLASLHNMAGILTSNPWQETEACFKSIVFTYDWKMNSVKHPNI